MNVYLIGFMGSGKSYTGIQLAKALNLSFVDLDEQIEHLAGHSIAYIFETEGEASFRNLEAKALRETIKQPAAIISCGGGTPCFHQNMDWINAHGLSIYLKASVPLLVSRLKKGQAERPLIRGLDEQTLMAQVTSRLQAREPFYAQAKFIVTQEDNQALVPQLIDLYHQYLSARG